MDASLKKISKQQLALVCQIQCFVVWMQGKKKKKKALEVVISMKPQAVFSEGLLSSLSQFILEQERIKTSWEGGN